MSSLDKVLQKPVDEEKDCAPGYYELIKEPMDLQTLMVKVKNHEIKTAKQFCTKMMLIWKNAQRYNGPDNKVYKIAKHCQRESKRLIKKYFPELYDGDRVHSDSPCNEELAIVKYINKSDKRVRECLLCPVCNERMDFMIGFHPNYISTKWDGEIYCSSCQLLLHDIKVGYYHCVKGCLEPELKLKLESKMKMKMKTKN